MQGLILRKAKWRKFMEQLKFEYPSAKRPVVKRAHVGVVGSGDMEILMEPSKTGAAHVFVQTSVDGFGNSWKAILDRFFSKYDGAVDIHINDAGATPGSVLLRLEQAVEVVEHD
jgi:malonate decarboxylase delta subunit